jgi:SAM-dependent methyltransferase
MTAGSQRAVEDCLIDLFQHLGIDRAHVAAGQQVASDWLGLATRYGERIASLSLVSPRPRPELRTLQCPVFILAGDQGATAEATTKALAELPGAASYILRGYEFLPWCDMIADRIDEIGPALSDFLNAHTIAPVSLAQGEGEVSGITYRIRGNGPPLVLMPLDLTPSQWEPLIPRLSERYCTISLGGPLLGIVAMLEGRGRSNYLSAVRAVLAYAQIKPGEVVLEVGGGSGVVLREIARRTDGTNRVLDIDINPYLLREAAALAKREGLSEAITFQEGSAQAIPLADGSVDVALAITVLEEGDADRMLAELVRVTKPGGRIGVIVRALDMPWWMNLPLRPDLRAKVSRPGYIGSGVARDGCADASLYQRFAAIGLTNLIFFPQLVATNPDVEPGRFAGFEQQIVATLTPQETAEWQRAAAAARADGTLFIAQPHHCAIGAKRG